MSSSNNTNTSSQISSWKLLVIWNISNLIIFFQKRLPSPLPKRVLRWIFDPPSFLYSLLWFKALFPPIFKTYIPRVKQSGKIWLKAEGQMRALQVLRSINPSLPAVGNRCGPSALCNRKMALQRQLLGASELPSETGQTC